MKYSVTITEDVVVMIGCSIRLVTLKSKQLDLHGAKGHSGWQLMVCTFFDLENYSVIVSDIRPF